MNILFINAICYTSEVNKIQRARSIKDTMIYDLCLAFSKRGHHVTLYAGEPYKPYDPEEYPFEVVWGECVLQNVFLPNKFPFMADLYKYIKRNAHSIDLIISSEVFSMNTLCAVLLLNQRLIIWHELAVHNAIMKKVPSKVWYNSVARFLMKQSIVVARSKEAMEFIKRYCKSTTNIIIDHGVNLDKFEFCEIKENYFIVCSQLIERKRIDGILREYSQYLIHTNRNTELYIVGDGDQKAKLMNLCERLNISDYVHFMGKLSHYEMGPLLSHAKAMLVNTIKDNSMISIVESIAVGTPVLTTEVPLNASYIQKYSLGIAKEWDYSDLKRIEDENAFFVKKCSEYRKIISTDYKVEQFMDVYREFIASR